MASIAHGFLPPPPDPESDRAIPRARAIGQGALTLVGVGGVLLLGRAVSVHAPPCPFRAITGVPCPGCGMTRLADALVHGHLGVAARADLAGVALLAALVVLAVAYLLSVVVRRGEPPRWMRSVAVPVVLVALAAIHWGTTIVTGTLPSS